MQFVLANWSQILGVVLGTIALVVVSPWLLMIGWDVLWPGRG